MKRLSLYLFLILFSFQTPSWADDIQDFQIEGMSVGDSALDYFSEEEINSGVKTNFNDKKFFAVDLNYSPKNYDAIQLNLKTHDKNFIIYGLVGGIFITKKKECVKYQNEIVDEINNIFKDFTKEHVKWNHPYDKTGRSKIDQIIFDLKNNTGSVVVSCYFWSKKIKNKENWEDSIRVELYTEKYANWLEEEAH